MIDLGHEAFERLFGPHHRARMSVFNVVVANGKGSFLADFTAPDLGCSIPVPGYRASAADPDGDPTRHTFFLRTVNSYNRTQAVRLEAGICRWICRNGMIFGKQSIQFRDPHHKTKHQLMDQIAERAEQLRIDELPGQTGRTYEIALPQEMTVLEGAWQTLKLAIPPVDPESRTARFWRDRCAALGAVAKEYQDQFGTTAFSVLQAASQWAREDAQTSPIQRHRFERRCGGKCSKRSPRARHGRNAKATQGSRLNASPSGHALRYRRVSSASCPISSHVRHSSSLALLPDQLDFLGNDPAFPSKTSRRKCVSLRYPDFPAPRAALQNQRHGYASLAKLPLPLGFRVGIDVLAAHHNRNPDLLHRRLFELLHLLRDLP